MAMTGDFLAVFTSDKQSPRWKAWFAISEEELMAFNNLQVKMVHAPMELKIPVCRLTPTNTFTTTYTPLLQLTTSTPGTRY